MLDESSLAVIGHVGYAKCGDIRVPDTPQCQGVADTVSTVGEISAENENRSNRSTGIDRSMHSEIQRKGGSEIEREVLFVANDFLHRLDPLLHMQTFQLCDGMLSLVNTNTIDVLDRFVFSLQCRCCIIFSVPFLILVSLFCHGSHHDLTCNFSLENLYY